MSGITAHRHARLRALPLALSTALVVIPVAFTALSAPVCAQTQQREYRFAIPAGPLEGALSAYGSQVKASISYEPGLSRGRTSPGVQGVFSAQAAFDRLLQGTGLQAVAHGSASYTLLAQDSSDTALQLGATTVDGLSDTLGNVSEGSRSYTVGQVSVGKAPQSIKETPQTVSVMTRQRLQDQQLTTLGKTLQQTTGITEFQGSMTSAVYLSRGFEVTNFRLDGGATLRHAAWMEMDTAIYDHVEVLRGADGLFAGAGEPGGTVNLVRKRPTATPQASIMLSAGSWDNYRQELDVSGPLAFDGRLRGRLVAVNQDRNSFIDYAGAKRKLVYGVLEADLDDTTTLYGGMTHDNLRGSDQDYGLPRYATGEDLKLPRSTYLAGATDVRYLTNDTYFLHVDRQLSDAWTLSLDTQYNRQREYRNDYNFNGAVDPQTGGGVVAEGGTQDFPKTEKAIDVSLKGTFEWFGLEHGLTAGWNWTDSNGRDDTYVSGDVVVDDIFNFDPKDYPSNKGRSTPYGLLTQRTKTDGVYGALRLQLAEPLHWFIGGSLNNYHYNYDNVTYSTGLSTPNKFEDTRVFLPYSGLTYDLTPEWTAYTSVAEIYKSQSDRYTGPPGGGTSLDPITGRNYELGIKGELLGGRLNTYTAVYYTQRNGSALRDPRYPYSSNSTTGTSCCYTDDGEVVSKGLDFEVSGELAERLEATFGYTYNHNENKVSGAAYNSLTPRHLAKLFATYQLPGVLSPLKIGGGVTAQSASYVSGSALLRDANGGLTGDSVDYRFSQAGYALWNAFAHYQLDEHWSVAGNLDNLFDKHYYSTVGYSDYGNFYGTPRNFTVSLRGEF
ncbi:TonB-dependent siderophore receptor [Pseudomonas cremoricolorata]|uniref:TonB-dependent siderophore receptor n=1 Tax=Pseudomonas cremoricolorata TaxID=157783 RepID=UPI000401F680|nr:TonB-dependent receptor [Pseudomonas cremoricolorata]